MAPSPKAIELHVGERLRVLNTLTVDRASEWLAGCCGSSRWVRGMLEARPFAGETALLDCAARVWNGLGADDWLEAFGAHPRIGDLVDADSASTTRGDRWSEREQARIGVAAGDERQALKLANDEYERRFGRIFIVCATGKSAGEILTMLQTRLRNDPATELRVAAAEQQAITALRLRKLLHEHE